MAVWTRFAKKNNCRPAGMELFEIMPIIVGGDPLDPQNKVWLTRQEHVEAVRYWNSVIRTARISQGADGGPN